MIVLGADMHKSSHTIAGIAATTGEMLGDKTVSVGVRGVDQVLRWARGLGVVPEEVGSSGPPWRLEVSDATSPKEDTG